MYIYVFECGLNCISSNKCGHLYLFDPVGDTITLEGHFSGAYFFPGNMTNQQSNI